VNRSEICERIASFVSGEVTCFDAPQGMIGCNLPITYPDGDYVTVYVGQRDDKWEVTDRGEGYMVVLTRYTPDFPYFRNLAQAICQSLGVVFQNGRVVSAAQDQSLVAEIWAVARAASRIAEAVSFYKPRKPRATRVEVAPSFADEVAHELVTRNVEIAREVPVVGASGHQHRVTLFVPSREAVIEPLLPASPFGSVSLTYAKFGDIAQANGYARYAVIDDRSGEPTADIVRLLGQVGQVVEWTEREPWLVRFMRPSLG
jgi:hypothetical protein